MIAGSLSIAYGYNIPLKRTWGTPIDILICFIFFDTNNRYHFLTKYLPLFGLFFNPSTPSCKNLSNQYNPHCLLLCSSSEA